jgi:hypothetical protein
MKAFTRAWHRRIAFAASLWLLMVAVTGLLIRHSHTLGLNQSNMTWEWALEFYGLPLEEWGPAYVVDDKIVVQRGQRVAWGEDYIIEHLPQEALRGALSFNGQEGAFCCLVFESELWLLDSQGHVLDKCKGADGLPSPILAASQNGLSLLLKTSQGVWQTNVPKWDTWEPFVGKVNFMQAQALRPQNQLPSEGLPWERVILDIHSGQIFGMGGGIASDMSALALIYLIASGFSIHFQQRQRSNARSKP